MSNESLSALFDGECTGKEVEQLLRTMEGSPELRQYWMRMCLAREAARGTQVPRVHSEFSDRVMAALATKPVPAAGGVVPFPAGGRRSGRPLAGLALAAGLAAVAVISVLQVNRGPQPVAQSLPATASAGVTGGAMALMPGDDIRTSVQTVPVSDERATVAPDQSLPADLRWAQVDSASAQQLTGYMIDHSNYRSAQGLGGLGYARVAAHFADYHPQNGQ